MAKRKQAASKQAQPSKKQQKQDGQKAISKDINVPIDEGFNESANVGIYVDDDDLIYDASLNQTNVGGNNNKVGHLSPHGDYLADNLESSIDYSCSRPRRASSTGLTPVGEGSVSSARSRPWVPSTWSKLSQSLTRSSKTSQATVGRTEVKNQSRRSIRSSKRIMKKMMRMTRK